MVSTKLTSIDSWWADSWQREDNPWEREEGDSASSSGHRRRMRPRRRRRRSQSAGSQGSQGSVSQTGSEGSAKKKPGVEGEGNGGGEKNMAGCT